MCHGEVMHGFSPTTQRAGGGYTGPHSKFQANQGNRVKSHETKQQNPECKNRVF